MLYLYWLNPAGLAWMGSVSHIYRTALTGIVSLAILKLNSPILTVILPCAGGSLPQHRIDGVIAYSFSFLLTIFGPLLRWRSEKGEGAAQQYHPSLGWTRKSLTHWLVPAQFLIASWLFVIRTLPVPSCHSSALYTLSAAGRSTWPAASIMVCAGAGITSFCIVGCKTRLRRRGGSKKCLCKAQKDGILDRSDNGTRYFFLTLVSHSVIAAICTAGFIPAHAIPIMAGIPDFVPDLKSVPAVVFGKTMTEKTNVKAVHRYSTFRKHAKFISHVRPDLSLQLNQPALFGDIITHSSFR